MKVNLLFLLTGLALLVACGGENDDEPTPDCNTSGLSLQLVSSSDASCGVADGEIVVSASGGAGEYEFSKDGTNFQAEATFSDLAASSYTITVRDANDCQKTLNVNVKNEDGIDLAVSSVTAAGCATSEGLVSVAATGGVEPYEFKLDNGTFGPASVFQGLENGIYSITARDAEGCSITQQVAVESGISFDDVIAPIIASNCAISSCHGGTQAPDFREFDNIKANAALIKTKTGNRSMPKDGSLSDEEIAAIACWVDDGAKDN